MSFVTIHRSGAGAETLRVDSWYNGGAYAVHFGAAPGPCRTLFIEGDSASDLRADYDARESAEPETPCRDHWLAALDPYLD